MRGIRFRLDLIIILLASILVGEAVSMEIFESLRDSIVQRLPIRRSSVLEFAKKKRESRDTEPPRV